MGKESLIFSVRSHGLASPGKAHSASDGPGRLGTGPAMVWEEGGGGSLSSRSCISRGDSRESPFTC